MQLVKRKQDKQYLTISLILLIVTLILGKAFVGITFVLGVLAATITIQKDISKLNSNKYDKKIVLNLLLNMIVYTFFLLISAYLYDIKGIILCGVGLVSYRSIFFNRLAKSKGV